MKRITIAFAAITLALLTTTSCSKSSSSGTATTAAQLVGTWSLYEYGQDANANGKLDAGEGVIASSMGVSEVNTLKGDGSGSTHIVINSTFGNEDTTYALTWTYSSSNNQLVISGNGETTYATVQSISSSSLTVVTHDTSSGTPVDMWDVFNKQ